MNAFTLQVLQAFARFLANARVGDLRPQASAGSAVAGAVVSLFNPARLIVHSILTEARDLFAEQVRFMIRKNCLELYSRNLNLEFRTYSPETNATGAVAFSRDGYFKKTLGVE